MGSLPRPKFIACMFGALLAAGLALSQQVFAAKAVLDEVIVTTQKRDESVQEGPVTITALIQEAVQTNGVANVDDLNGLAPNLLCLKFKDIDLGFAGSTGEIALWGRYRNDNDEPILALNLAGLAQSAQYREKRSYGIDFIAQF